MKNIDHYACSMPVGCVPVCTGYAVHQKISDYRSGGGWLGKTNIEVITVDFTFRWLWMPLTLRIIIEYRYTLDVYFGELQYLGSTIAFSVGSSSTFFFLEPSQT